MGNNIKYYLAWASVFGPTFILAYLTAYGLVSPIIWFMFGIVDYLVYRKILGEWI